MKQNDEFDYVSMSELRLGLFMDLELGWLSHPFASSRFKISDEQQIQVLKGLGQPRLRYVPVKSDPIPVPLPQVCDQDSPKATPPLVESLSPAQSEKQKRAALLATQQESLAVCDRRFSESARQYKKALGHLVDQPSQAAQLSRSVVQGLVRDIHTQGDAAIRLLTEVAGDKFAMHAVNVTVIALLLGRAMGMQEAALQDLGLAAFMHDAGKVQLPDRMRNLHEHFSSSENKVYQSHVERGVRLAIDMGLSPDTIRAIAEHHELADGSGFPRHLKQQEQSLGGCILALVNRYDALCNPLRASAAMTPHEALAMIFAQEKTRFEGNVLSAFIRMIGVYPPGSVVQLNDERHALVVSVNSARPLKPRVIVHEPGSLPHEALILDLEFAPNVSIRRSIKPASLSAAALEYLQPRQRICYFFEPAANASSLVISA